MKLLAKLPSDLLFVVPEVAADGLLDLLPILDAAAAATEEQDDEEEEEDDVEVDVEDETDADAAEYDDVERVEEADVDELRELLFWPRRRRLLLLLSCCFSRELMAKDARADSCLLIAVTGPR